MRKLLLAGAALLGLSTSAYATNITVTGYDLPDAQAFSAGVFDGYSYYDGPINLHTSVGDIIAYCADVNHILQSGVDYTFGLLTHDGLGNAISASMSSRIGHLASAGFSALAANDGDLAAAIQLAIWSLEYGTAVTSFANSTIANDFTFAEGLSFANTGYATTLVPVGNWPANAALSQQMVVGFAASAPEPSTWAMGLIGFGLIGGLGWKRSRALRVA
jgi:PEP-CTERM motif